MTTKPLELLRQGIAELQLALEADSLEKMFKHLNILLDWNKKINLTSLRNPEDIVILHFLDSLTVLKVVPCQNIRILDIGTGGGFPGLVLAAACSKFSIMLLDNNPKKIVFLKNAAARSDIKNTEFFCGSYDEAGIGSRLGTFDAVISRAFSRDTKIISQFHRFLIPGGYLIMMLGPGTNLETYSPANFIIESIWEGNLPFTDHERKVVLYRKTTQSS